MTPWRQLSLLKGPRQRGIRPPLAPERNVHIMVADMLARWARPEWEWTHFPAGELRPEKTGVLLKRMGTRPGWPDFILLDPGGKCHGLELKRGTNPLTPAQGRIQSSFQVRGCPYEVARSFAEAIAVLKRWGVVQTGITVAA